MKKLITICLLLAMSFTVKAQTEKMSTKQALDVIQSYYKGFDTGYEFNGKHKVITNNYKIANTDCKFIVSFNVYDIEDNKNTSIIQFNWKDIETIDPMGTTDVADAVNEEKTMIPINGKLLFKTKSNSYVLCNNKKVKEFYLNIYYQVDNDVTTTTIYRAFMALKSNCNK